MSDKIINWDLDSLPLQDVLKRLQHQIVVKRICGNQEKFKSTLSFLGRMCLVGHMGSRGERLVT